MVYLLRARVSTFIPAAWSTGGHDLMLGWRGNPWVLIPGGCGFRLRGFLLLLSTPLWDIRGRRTYGQLGTHCRLAMQQENRLDR